MFINAENAFLLILSLFHTLVYTGINWRHLPADIYHHNPDLK